MKHATQHPPPGWLLGRLSPERGTWDNANRFGRQLAALNAPDTAQWAEIQSAGQAFGEARFKVEALELRLEIASECDRALDVIAGDPARDIHVLAGRSLTAPGEGQVKIRLPGIAALTVSGSAADATEWGPRL